MWNWGWVTFLLMFCPCRTLCFLFAYELWFSWLRRGSKPSWNGCLPTTPLLRECWEQWRSSGALHNGALYKNTWHLHAMQRIILAEYRNSLGITSHFLSVFVCLFDLYNEWMPLAKEYFEHVIGQEQFSTWSCHTWSQNKSIKGKGGKKERKKKENQAFPFCFQSPLVRKHLKSKTLRKVHKA